MNMNQIVYTLRPPTPVFLAAEDRVGELGASGRKPQVRCILCAERAEFLYRNPDVCREVPLCLGCNEKARAAWSKPWAQINDRLSLASVGYYYNRKRARRWTKGR